MLRESEECRSRDKEVQDEEGSLSEDCEVYVPEGSCDLINDSDSSHTEAPG